MRLHEFIASRHGEIIRRCHATIGTTLGAQLVTDHQVIPLFLNHLMNELRLRPPSPLASRTVPAQSHDDVSRGDITLSQVAHHYVEVCLTITELALDESDLVETNDFRCMDRCLDQAIADLLTEHMATHEPQPTTGGGRQLSSTSRKPG